jgi:hypothetical protein
MLGAGLVGLVGMSFPAGVLATQHASQKSSITQHIVTNSVLKNDHFKLNFTVQQGALTGYGGRYPSTVVINLNKTSGSASQKNQYTFSKKVHIKTDASFSKESVSATFSKNYGKLKMTWTPKGSTFTSHAPKGCSGSAASARRGTLKGTFKLKAGGKIKTVKIKSIPATLSNTNFTCNGSSKGVQLISPPTAKVGAYATGGSKTSVSIFSYAHGSGYNFTHTYTVSGVKSDFTYSFSGKGSATLKGSNGMKGTATFTGTNKVSSKLFDGTMSGKSFSVSMASIGKVTPFAKSSSGYQLKK